MEVDSLQEVSLMTELFVCFDLEGAQPGDYNTAWEILGTLGFSRLSPNGKVRLPSTTCMVSHPNPKPTKELISLLENALLAAGLKPSATLVIQAADWAASSRT